MKILIHILASIASLLLIAVSCVDLRPEKYDVINSTIFPSDKNDAEALVIAAAYSTFRNNKYTGIFNSANGIQIISELSTDVAECQWAESIWGELLYHNWTPNYNYINLIYNYSRDFSKMILAEHRIADIDMPDAQRKLLIAELQMARGWLGYLMYDFFGPIPVPNLDVLLKPADNIIVERLADQEMVSYIETELKSACETLPARYDAASKNYGRFTKALAKTVLMKLYMHEHRWDEAEKTGRELMTPEYGFKLMDKYDDIFKLKYEKNDEIIYAVQEDRATSQQLWHAHVLPGNYPTDNSNILQWNGFRVPWDFYHSYSAADKRLKVLIGSYTGTDGVEYSEANKGFGMVKGAIPLKYGEDPEALGEESQVDWIVYRYADIITLLSEAIVRQNGVTEEAVDLLNMIRRRAGISLFSTIDFTSTEEFLDQLLLERGHEFFFEGLRRSDLIRHGKFIEYAREKKGSITTKNEFVLFPIPQSVINEGKGKIIQNPGY